MTKPDEIADMVAETGEAEVFAHDWMRKLG
jgi:hypothetical protein